MYFFLTREKFNPDGWGVEYNNCISAPNECPGYNIKLSDGEAQAWEIWGMWSIPSFPSLSGLLSPGVVEPGWVLSMGPIELFGI